MRAKLSKGPLTALLVLSLLLAGIPVSAEDQGGMIQTPSVASAEPSAGRLASDIQVLTEKADEDGRVTVVIKLKGPSLLGVEQGRVVEKLKQQAPQSQRGVLKFLNRPDAVVLNTFWLTNAVLAEVPIDLLDALASLPEVERLFENFAITIPEPPEEESLPRVLSVDYTWGLEKIGAPEVWDMGITGSGVRVAVLDTGVDITHPDLAGKMWTDAPADPTYPGGWIEFDGDGNIVVGSTPYDTAGHGTHTSGTVLGGDASGIAIGVAPGAWLMHGLVIPGGGGTFAQVIAGMEWAIDPFDQYGTPAGEPADVISMSLGASGYYDEMIEPVQNIEAAGIVLSAATGNEGEGTSRSPGNVYEAFGIGATDIDDEVAGFSSGEVVDWPASHPEPYIKPDFSAPGVDVYSSLPGGEYEYWSGTSMAAPHVAGAVALMLEGSPDLTVEDVHAVLEETAVDLGDEGQDTRYGWGRIDAFEAVSMAALDSGIEGVVTDAETVEPLEGARIFVSETGRAKYSDDSGYYRFFLPPGSYNLTASAFGYYEENVTVEVLEGAFTLQDFALEPMPTGFIEGTVTDVETEEPIEGAIVTLLDTPLSTATNETGEYSIEAPAGTYDVRAWAWGYWASIAPDVVVPEDATVVVNLALEPALFITDPVGDQFYGYGPDIVGADFYRDDTTIYFRGRTAEPIDPNDTVNYMLLDLDLNAQTGFVSDDPYIPTNDIGADAVAVIYPYGLMGEELSLPIQRTDGGRQLETKSVQASSTGLRGELGLWDPDYGGFYYVGSFPVFTDTDYFWFAIPLDMLEDDGIMSVVDVIGDSGESTDVAPNEGHGITGEGPDLVIADKWEEWVDEDAGTYTVHYVVKNQGNVAVPAGHETALTVDGVPLETKEVPVALAPGEEYPDFFPTIVTITPPTDEITVCADFYDVVDELSEENNCLTSILWAESAWTEFITDPTGDQFYGYGPDIVGADFYRDETTIYLRVRTAEPIDLYDTVNEMWLDLDLNAQTGYVSPYPYEPTNDIGADAAAFIFPGYYYGTAGEKWSSPLRRTDGGRQLEAESAQALFGGLRGELGLWDPYYEWFDYAGSFSVFTDTDYFWFAIPLDMLEDDGIMSVVNIIGDYWEPTDVAPNEGHGITGEGPDLVIADKWEEWVDEDEGTYRVHYVVRNQGNMAAPANHETALTVDGSLLKTKPVPVELTPGDEYPDFFDTIVTLSPPADAITVCADFSDVVDELSEENNCLTNTGDVVQVTTDPDWDYSPAITQTDDGTVWVVWYSERSWEYPLWYKTSSDGGATWSADSPVGLGGMWGYSPAIAQTDDGKIWVTFSSWESGNDDIWYTTSSDGGETWSAPSQITTDPGSDYDPAITQTSDGKIWVAWYSYRSGNGDIWYKTSVDGGTTWSDDYQLTTDTNSDYEPAITQTDDGTVWVVWYSERSWEYPIWYKTSSDGGETWSEDSPIDLGYMWGYQPAIAQTSDGKIWVTFTSWQSGNEDIWYTTSSDGGASWSRASRFTRFVGYDGDAAATALSSGHLALTWVSDRSANYDIWYGIIGLMEDINPPPVLNWAENEPRAPDTTQTVTVRAAVGDESGIEDVQLVWWVDGEPQDMLSMYDDGAHNDYSAGDGVYGSEEIGPFPLIGTVVEYQIQITDIGGKVVTAPQYPYRFKIEKPFQKTADILVVADEYYYGDQYYQYYAEALDNLGYAYDVWDCGLRGNIDGETLNQYLDGIVIWATPYWGYISYDETMNNLSSYLDNGGKLFISGQDIGSNIGWSSFYQDYLHATYVQDNIGLYGLFGVPGDPITDGLYVSISGDYGANNQYSPDEIDPIWPAEAIFTYDPEATAPLSPLAEPIMAVGQAPPSEYLGQKGPGTTIIESSGSGALRVDTGVYRVVYFAFGFEAINYAADRATVMQRVITALSQLAVVTSELTPGVVGEEYNATLQACGGTKPYTWAIIDGALPDGLGLDGETGVISGTPTEAGTFDFTVEVTDAAEATATRELSICIVVLTEFITDPVGDQFSGYGPDIVGADFYLDDTTIYFRGRTAEPIDPNDTVNLMWLDLDLNAQTGYVSPYPDIPTNDIGADAYAVISPVYAYGMVGEEWSLPVQRTDGGRQLEAEPAQVSSAGLMGELYLWDPDGEYFYYVGNFHVFTDTQSFWSAIPLDMLDDDGIMSVVDVIGDYWEPTDVAPNEGHGTTIVKYTLTIDSTIGGDVTTPDEETFTYDAGTVVDLVATPDAGYRFVGWTGDVDTIADVDFASTNITMNGDYSITANFEEVVVEVIRVGYFTGSATNLVKGEIAFTPDPSEGITQVAGWAEFEEIDLEDGTYAFTGVGNFTANEGFELEGTVTGIFTVVENVVIISAAVDAAAPSATTMQAEDVEVVINLIEGDFEVSLDIPDAGSIELTARTSSIQAGIDVAQPGNTVEVAAGEYDAFEVIEQTDISIISTEGATVTTALEPEVGYWVMALVQNSADITIDGIDFDGSGVSEDMVEGIIYGNSTGTLANLTVSGVVGNVTSMGIVIWGETTGATSADISEVTVEDSYIGVMIWNAEANLNLTTITGRGDPHGGVGLYAVNGAVVNIENCEISNFWVETLQPGTAGFGMMIGIPVDYEEPQGITLGEELESVVEMIGSTIADNNIGIYVDEYGNLTANFNNIFGNDLFGVLSEATVDAIKNWWGNATGPHHETLNPEGTGDAVSNNVSFEPWLGAAVVTVKREPVTDGGIVDAKDEAGTEVLVSGNATVTVALYADNPGGSTPTGFSSLGKYIDVYIPDTTAVSEIQIRLYYTDAEVAGLSESSLRLRWWNGTEWVQCSDSGVNTASTNGYSGYMWAKIRTDTTPKLEQLAGTPFGGYGQLPSPRPPSPTPPVTPRVKYDLTIDSTAGGSVATPSEGTFTYNKGTVVGLVATPDAGYRFVNWTVDVGTIADVNDATTTITMNGDYSIRANFVKQYDLTVSSVEGGSVTTPGKGMFTYDKGTVVNLVATPGAGYRFVNWTGNVSTIANVNAAATTITMNGDYSITANFIKQYNLTISSTIGGEVTTPSEGTFAYDEETVINLVAKPDKGYRFANWTGDVDTIANVNAATTTITMNADYSITANFEARVNWALLGGIIAAVVVAGLAIFFLLRRRRRAA